MVVFCSTGDICVTDRTRRQILVARATIVVSARSEGGKILVARATLLATKKKGIMSLLDLGPVIFGDIDGQITWFQTKSLLSRQVTCPSCGAAMVLQHRSDIQDKQRY